MTTKQQKKINETQQAVRYCLKEMQDLKALILAYPNEPFFIYNQISIKQEIISHRYELQPKNTTGLYAYHGLGTPLTDFNLSQVEQKQEQKQEHKK